MKALLLNSSYYPVQVIDWKRAMILFFTGRAEVVEHHENLEINSPNKTYKLPKVMRLFGSFKNFSKVKFNRNNVFYRDKHMCQYCGDKFKASELTFDHVIPRSRGGPTTWTNIVSSCDRCNSKKADKTPKEWGVRLINIPIEPKWTPIMAFRLTRNEIVVFSSWLF